MKRDCYGLNFSRENEEYYYNIEFLRIIAILAVLMLHMFYNKMGVVELQFSNPLYYKLYNMTGNGQKGVDLFFIISGLFFYLGLVKNQQQCLWDFTKKKIIRMWPVMFFSVVVAFVFSLFDVVKFFYWDNLYALLFLNGTPLHKANGNIGVSWYCSAMLVHFILFFYLLKNFSPKKVWLVIAIGVYISYSIILQAKGFKISNNSQTFGYIFNVGMLRAWGGIGLGLFIGLWYNTYSEQIKNYCPQCLTKWMITFLEFICLYFMINNLMLHKFKHFNHFLFIIVFVVLIVCFISRKGYISQLLNRAVFFQISKYVYSIFITHPVVFSILKSALWQQHKTWVDNHCIINWILTFALAFVVGIITYHFVEVPAKKYLTIKWVKK